MSHILFNLFSTVALPLTVLVFGAGAALVVGLFAIALSGDGGGKKSS